MFPLLLVLALVAGCALNPFRSVHEKAPETPTDVARHAIDEANTAIAAAAKTLLVEYEAGRVTWDEFASARADLNKARDYTKDAQTFLDLADLPGANSKLSMANLMLGPVKNKLAAIKKGGAQ